MKDFHQKGLTSAVTRQMWAILTLLLALHWPALAQTARVRYTVALSDPARHLVHVDMQVTPAADLKVQLPVWNALYQVRDFSQSVLSVQARDGSGNAVPARPLDKTTWSVPNAHEVEYELEADSPGPFGAQFNSEHAFFNLAEILMYVVGQKTDSVAVQFTNVPPHWKIATSMTRAGDTFTAQSYDDMVDSPVEVGTYAESAFEQDGARFDVVVDAQGPDYDMKAIAGMDRKLAAAEIDWMTDRPFDHYLFIYHFPPHPAGGGMEHAYSTAIDASADRVKNNPRSLADVTAHEFFHLWNVKRIRPQSLEPVDYTQEQYTRALWFSEGVTSTVADYMRVRAGYLDEQGFLDELAYDIAQLESRPAHLTQSVEDSSLDAWLEKYPAYLEPDRSVSYYNKGEIVGMLLDLQMRQASAGKKSLRDLFQWMNQHYAKQGKFFPDSAGVEQAAEAVTGADFRDFFARYVAGVEPIPYDQFLATVGLRLQRQTTTAADAGFRSVRRFGTVATVVSVTPGGAAEKAGLRPGDVVEQVNGRSVDTNPESAISTMNLGDKVELLVTGGGGTRRLSFKVAARPVQRYSVVDTQPVTPEQRARRSAWMRGDSE